SIFTIMEEGVKPINAAIESSNELIMSLLISSLTTSAAFLAFFLAENTMGEIMGPLFSVITLALLSSWILAMTMVTMLAVAFIRVKLKSEKTESKKSIFDLLIKYYDRLLRFALKKSLLVILAIFAMFMGSLFLFPMLPFIFFPDSDRNLVTLDLELPLGTKIEYTNEVIGQIESFIEKELMVNEERSEGIVDWTTFIGKGPFSYDLGYTQGEEKSSYAHMLLNTNDQINNQNVIDVLDDFCFENLPDAEVTVSRLGSGGGGGPDVEVRVFGDSPTELFRIAEKVKQEMVKIPYAKNVKDDWGPKIKKFIVNIDQDKANRAGLTNQDIAISLQTS
ncbi:MAG: efflux RND transporter permease subunit, partial [Bacteroidota bacterium]